MSLSNILMEQIGKSQLSEVSKAVGADDERTRSALAMGLPLLLGAMARNASKPEGAEALSGALERDHDGSLLDDIAGFVQKKDTTPGDGILKHVLGNRRTGIEKALGQGSGLDTAQASRLLSTVAPLVMAALGKQRREQNLDTRQLSEMLTHERATSERATPALKGLAGLIDQDGDGSAMDDLADLAKGFLGRKLGGRN